MATLNSGGNTGGFRTEPGEHLVVEPSCPLCGGFQPHRLERHAAEGPSVCVNCGDDDGPYRVCLDCLERLA